MFPQKVLIITKQHFLMEKYAVRKLLTRPISDLLLKSSAKLPVSPSAGIVLERSMKCTAVLNKYFSPRSADGRFFPTGGL